MRVLAIFCASFAAGIALSQYLLPAQWALILCGVFAAAALIMGLCGCANKRGGWAKRAFLCALGLAFALGYNTLYAHFIKAPNNALLGTQDTVAAELLGYAEETSHGAKVTVKILNRGLPGRAIYYGDAELLDLEPGAHVTAEALFNRTASAQFHGQGRLYPALPARRAGLRDREHGRAQISAAAHRKNARRDHRAQLQRARGRISAGTAAGRQALS